MHEHRVIERMLAILKKQLDSISTQQRVDPKVIDIATDFIRTYADRCHHGKEEDILFRRLSTKDLDTDVAQVTDDLIEEHKYGRKLTRKLVEANLRYADGDERALDEIEASVRALVEFYPVHIEKEDHHFFKPCLAYFSEAEQAQMLLDFDEFDRSLIHARYLEIVEELENGPA